MLNIKYETNEQGIEELKKAVGIRNQMGSALYFNILDDECLTLAQDLANNGIDKKTLAEIGGWELRK